MTDTKITPAQLDFDSIKASLKTWFSTQAAFADYNFDGSTLSVLLDVLAYNTHLNALQANLALNESFIDTAQLRGSVVSIAKALNYIPRSRNSAYIEMDIQFNSVPGGTAALVLPKYTSITSSIDGITYTFYTLDEYEANEANGYKISNAEFYEGRLVSKRFIVDSDQVEIPIYVIPDKNLYFDSLSVVRKDGLAATENFTVLTRPSSVADFNVSEDIYVIQESSNGYYELLLGDSIMGNKPQAGSIIDCTYLSSNGLAANGAKVFNGTINIDGYSSTLTSLGQSVGGSERESIDSIRVNAPRNFAAQNRAVTAYDYKTMIYNAVTNIEAISVWGGEENVPPEYGTVFVSVKPTGAEALTDVEKTQLLVNVLNPRKIATIDVKFADPEIQYIEFITTVTYDPGMTLLTKQQIENLVRQSTITYCEDNLTNFESKLYKSKFLAYVDSIDRSFMNTDTEIRLQRRVMPEYGVAARYDTPFTIPIASVEDYDHVVTSDTFEYAQGDSTYTCRLRNRTGSTTMEIYRAGASADIIVVDNAGYIDTATNTVVLLPFKPVSSPFAEIGIKITAIPANQNALIPNKNLLLRIDSSISNVTAVTIDE